MRLEARGLAALAVVALVSSCELPSDSNAPGTLSAGDQQIAASLYAGTPRTPLGFSDDPVPSGFTQVTTYHLKASQFAVAPAASSELCSDD